ncbi:hypothetical protein ACP4OV_004694 [Aristida adscensionis]
MEERCFRPPPPGLPPVPVVVAVAGAGAARPVWACIDLLLGSGCRRQWLGLRHWVEEVHVGVVWGRVRIRWCRTMPSPSSLCTLPSCSHKHIDSIHPLCQELAMDAPRAYVDFVPPHSLQEEPDKLTLRVDLSAEGFKKEQLRVQIDNRGKLRISGERPPVAGGKQWRRFRKDFAVPEGCDASAVRARLEKGGFLCITMPWLSTAAAEEPAANAAGVAGQDQKAVDAIAAPRQAGPPAADTQAQEQGGREDDAGAASTEGHPGQDEQAHDTSSNAGAAAAAAAAGQPAYGFARERRSRRMVWAILAFVLALVGAGLYARYRLMEPSAEPAPGSHAIVSLSDS